ncbi:MAG: cation-efflux pump, partial [Alistipes sp.]|nr:cation-efflux pump [Alistipes sp.]
RMNGNTPLAEAHSLASEVEKRLKYEFGKDTHIGIHMEPLK